MDETLAHFWQQLLARPSGPLGFRFVIQPLVACALAVRDGLHDAKTNRPAYFWALFTQKTQRRALLISGWRSINRLLILAFAMDVVYQLVALKRVRLGEAIVIAAFLAAVPYTLLRGPVNRLAHRIRSHKP